MNIPKRFVLIVVTLLGGTFGCERPLDLYDEDVEIDIQFADVLYQPRLYSPKNGRVITTTREVLLRWGRIPAATSYDVQVSKDTSFAQLAFSATADTTFIRTSPLNGSTFYWRVRSIRNQEESFWTSYNYFYLRVD